MFSRKPRRPCWLLPFCVLVACCPSPGTMIAQAQAQQAATDPAAANAPSQPEAPAEPAAQTGKSRKRPIPDQATLEKNFQELLSGASLVGSFTTIGQAQAEVAEDKYVLEEVKPLKNGYWLFKSRIQYGGRDVQVPLALEVKWAGDTPVITLTNVLVPGLGTFTARVLFHGNQYAGTWDAGDHGGHMYGRVVRTDATTEAATNSDSASSAQPPAAAAPTTAPQP